MRTLETSAKICLHELPVVYLAARAERSVLRCVRVPAPAGAIGDAIGRSTGWFITQLGLKRLILGYDSTLGKDREGNAARLTEIGLGLGYDVEVVPALGDESGVVSSTEIRKLVIVGKVEEAARLMGHPYGLQGLVSHGDQRGRGIGFPTANLDYAREKVMPAGGIYACWAYVVDEKHMAAVNLGTNPQHSLPIKEH